MSIWQVYGTMYGKCMASFAECGVSSERKARIFRASTTECGNLFMLFKPSPTFRPTQMTRSEQTMNNKIRFTTWLKPQTDLLITDLAKGMSTTKCSVIENAVNFYAGKSGDKNSDDLDLLRKQLNKVQEQNEHLLNILNSLCVALGYDDNAEFSPADSHPSKWLQESKNIHHQNMLKKKTDKLIKESEYH